MTDREQILEAFYRNAIHLPQDAVDKLKGTAVWRARVGAAYTIARELDAINAYEGEDRLDNINVPVRILLGTELTAFLRAASETFAGQIRGAHVVALHGQAHQAIDLDRLMRVRTGELGDDAI